MALGQDAGFRVFRGAGRVADALGATVVAFGKFDGVHLGHRVLLARAAETGYRLGMPHGAATFDRNPYAHFRSHGAPPDAALGFWAAPIPRP